MDLFKNMFSILTGNYNELDKPVFTKPYVDKTYDMLDLARQLDQAPEESKPALRDAMEIMAARIKALQTVNDLLTNSDMPLIILNDLHLQCKAGSANIDFVLLSNRFIAAVLCPASRRETAAGESGEAAEAGESSVPGEAGRQPSSEHSAYILTELLKEENLISKKNLQMVRPLTVQTQALADTNAADTKENGLSAFSRTYLQIHSDLSVQPDDFLKQIKQLFQVDDQFCWIINKELFTISDILLRYEEAFACSADARKG